MRMEAGRGPHPYFLLDSHQPSHGRPKKDLEDSGRDAHAEGESIDPVVCFKVPADSRALRDCYGKHIGLILTKDVLPDVDCSR
jgi:hypothetical protein